MRLTWPEAAGLHDCEVTLANGDAARFTLALPPTRTADTPLVLVLHYGGEPHGFYGRPLVEMLAMPAWPGLGAVYIAPVARGGDWQQARNRDFALALLHATEAQYGTSTARRLLLGYSLGAIGTWHLLACEPALFAAAVPLAGPGPALEGPLTTPVHAINSTTDHIFPVADTTRALTALQAGGAPVAWTLLEGVDHFAVPRFAAALAALEPWVSAQRRTQPG